MEGRPLRHFIRTSTAALVAAMSAFVPLRSASPNAFAQVQSDIGKAVPATRKLPPSQLAFAERTQYLNRRAQATPPWINKHGYLLRSLRRNVHRGGNRA